DRRLHFVSVRDVDNVHQLRPRPALDAAHLRSAYGAAEEEAHLQEAPSRTHKEVAGLPREHDRCAGCVDPLIAKPGGGLAQSLPRVSQVFGQIFCQRSFGRRPTVVRLAFFNPLLAMVTLAPRHSEIVTRAMAELKRIRDDNIPWLVGRRVYVY